MRAETDSGRSSEIKEQIGQHFVESLERMDSSLMLHLVPGNILREISFFNFGNAITGCYFADRQFVVRQVNRNFQGFFPNGRQLVGKNLGILFQEMDIPDDIRKDFRRQIVEQGYARLPRVPVCVRKQERYFSLYSTVTHFRDLGPLTGIQGQFVDITNEVLLRKRQDHLASQIRHDMKNRIASFLMSSQMLLDEHKALVDRKQVPAELEGFFSMLDEILRDVHTNADYLNKLVLQMLDVSKLQSNQLALKLGTVNARRMLDEIGRALRPLQESRGLRVEIHGELPDIEADEVQLNRVLENYHSNALKYAKSLVRWEVGGDDDEAVISVRDDGEGIPREYLERIFQPFFQVPGKEKKGSTGLGLDSVRELVRLHGGKTWAESEGAGTGSRFVLTLPTHRTGGNR
ncbi:MAG: HAMP domain-containing histidine kinase [Candidatus Lambdaproteobacteria bacterium]|nr:HAMP domain-containing histidine kinase [Candidatus Lambdaproteobacteria bacterium]